MIMVTEHIPLILHPRTRASFRWKQMLLSLSLTIPTVILNILVSIRALEQEACNFYVQQPEKRNPFSNEGKQAYLFFLIVSTFWITVPHLLQISKLLTSRYERTNCCNCVSLANGASPSTKLNAAKGLAILSGILGAMTILTWCIVPYTRSFQQMNLFYGYEYAIANHGCDDDNGLFTATFFNTMSVGAIAWFLRIVVTGISVTDILYEAKNLLPFLKLSTQLTSPISSAHEHEMQLRV